MQVIPLVGGIYISCNRTSVQTLGICRVTLVDLDTEITAIVQ
jgi:hypothetical protein